MPLGNINKLQQKLISISCLAIASCIAVVVVSWSLSIIAVTKRDDGASTPPQLIQTNIVSHSRSRLVAFSRNSPWPMVTLGSRHVVTSTPHPDHIIDRFTVAYTQEQEAIGFPLPAMTGTRTVTGSLHEGRRMTYSWSIPLPLHLFSMESINSGGRYPFLPLRPEPIPFVINTLFYAGILWVLSRVVYRFVDRITGAPRGG